MADLTYELDGVPEDLAEHVRTGQKLRQSLLDAGATGIRLVRLANGWSNPRDAKLQSDEAYEVQVLGRPGRENDTSAGPWGKCYVKLDGEWCFTNISAC